ncbi:unnamed protein product [Lepeophtheirus salmonis]|uniref:(salmon louse) hypothetical protein n=1 Tax=Lepeophtheirus salmonis TaxID=72036 RepID=A0A7R8CQZ9_LEPSM|nr:unnamed protein product [Lepeophtheirus salmonis]CAF2850628.1 unnamed protein product [Lepeophtheirus salmonis]
MSLTIFVLFFVGISQGLRIRRDELDALRKVIPGEPKADYPIYSIDILKKVNPAQFGLAPRKKNTNGKENPEKTNILWIYPWYAQKDYPVNSPASLLKKNPTKYKGIQHAPSFLIPKNYPKNKLPPRPQNLPSNLPKSKSPNAGGSNEGQSAQPLLINNANK